MYQVTGSGVYEQNPEVTTHDAAIYSVSNWALQVRM